MTECNLFDCERIRKSAEANLKLRFDLKMLKLDYNKNESRLYQRNNLITTLQNELHTLKIELRESKAREELC